MTVSHFPNRQFMQMCWVVTDLQVAIRSWARTAGVGPFFCFDGVPFADGQYRGQPAEFPAGERGHRLCRRSADRAGVPGQR